MMHFVTGSATIITSKKRKYLNIRGLAIQQAREMLENPEWETECDY